MRGSILNPDEGENEDLTQPATNPWWKWLKGRSKGWWTGVAVTFVLTVVLVVLIEDRYNVQIRIYGPLVLFLGGAVGDWIATRIHTFREDLAYDPYKAAQLRRLLRRVQLVTGVLLFIINILPKYQDDVFGGGGYYWSTWNTLLAGIGAVLTLLAFATKPKDDNF